MSKRAIVTFLFMALGLIVLSGCTPCDMVAPDLVGPDWRDILSGDLVWSYSDSCEPDHFEIVLAADASFSPIEHSIMVSGSSTSWTPTGLDNAREYYWKVRAEDEGDYGPWSSEFRSFFTGPTCSAADLVLPNLVYPPYGGIYDNSTESLTWEWPISSCIPESYRVEVSMDSDFVDTTYNGGTGTPGTRWGFGSTPPDATQFWWRITPFSDGVWGPTSIVYSFFTPPICTGASLVAAEAHTPLPGEFVPIGNPEFTWSYPDTSCVPEGYFLRIYRPWDWDDWELEADNPTSAATSFQAGYTLPDCNEYMWQVQMVSEGIYGPWNIGQRFVVDSGSCDCAPGATTIPELDLPDPYGVLPDTYANLRWHNPGGCFSDGQSVKISDTPDFSDTSRDVMIPHPFNASFDPPALDPATQYWWKVAFYVDDAGSPVIGDYSGQRSFFTGPECTSITEVTAPVLDLPADGATVDTLTPLLRYHPGDPGCIPDEYFINLQTDPAFGGTNELGPIPIPSTAVLTDPLIDCTTYYWKVNAVQGGVDGPESAVGSFYVNETGSCLPPGLPGTAKSNNFCRLGTFPEHFEALATILDGDQVLAIARNSFSTYLLMNILDQETVQPYKNEIICWSYFDHFELMGSIEDLPIKNPPPTPTPTPVVCHDKLNEEDCKAAGGVFKKICHCTQ